MKKKLIIIFCILIAVFLSFFIRLNNSKFLYGDQIHYVIMSYSLIQDKDLDLKNDYTSEKYREYYNPETLDPHVKKSDLAKDKWYSLHNPGLAILITPFIFFLGWKGGILAMILVSFLLLFLTYQWTKKNTGNSTISLISTAILFASTFYLGLIGYIFPDLLTATLILSSLLLLEKENKTKFHIILLSILLGISVWIHIKSILIFATIGIFALAQILAKKSRPSNKIKELLCLVAPAFLFIALFEWKLIEWYGVIFPTSAFASDQMFTISPLFSITATLFDSAKGFLANNPIFFIGLMGLPLWIKIMPKKILKIAIIIIPSFLLQSTFRDWSGGFSPAGRYFLEILPIFMPAIGFLLFSTKNIFLKILFYLLLILQTVFVFFFISTNPPWTTTGENNPFLPFLNNITPHLTAPEYLTSHNIILIITYCFFCLLLFYIGYLLSKTYTHSKKVKSSTMLSK